MRFIHIFLNPKILSALAVLLILLIWNAYPDHVSSVAVNYTDNLPVGSFVKAKGRVKKVEVAGKNLIIEIPEYPRIFIPEDIASNILVEEGDVIHVAGVLKTYRGEKEIVVVSILDVRILSE